MTARDREARLHDAVTAAAARDATAEVTGRRRDGLLAVLAVIRVGWRLRRASRAASREAGGS